MTCPDCGVGDEDSGLHRGGPRHREEFSGIWAYSPTPRAVRRSRSPSTSRSTTTCPPREAQNGVGSRSGILQTPKELVESLFPLRNQTWKETFCSWTRKPNSYPFTSGVQTVFQGQDQQRRGIRKPARPRLWAKPHGRCRHFPGYHLSRQRRCELPVQTATPPMECISPNSRLLWPE